MTKARVYRIYNDEGRVQGRLEDRPLERIGAGEVLIRTVWSSVNYKDALAATGAGQIIRSFPLIGGIDASGVVEESDSDDFSPGDRVLVSGYALGVAHDGGYAEYLRVPAEWVIPLPRGLDLREAMALGTAGLTVALCVKRMEDNGQRPEDGPILVTGATGGVGSLAVDIYSALGYEVVALTGKKAEHGYLRDIGAAEILERQAVDLEGPPLEKALWAGAVDNVGGDVLAWLTRTVKPWGNITSVGLAGGSHLQTTVMPFILRGIALLGVTSSGCPTDVRRALWLRLGADLHPRHLDRIISQVVKMEELPQVFERMLKGKTTGRTLVRIGEEPG